MKRKKVVLGLVLIMVIAGITAMAAQKLEEIRLQKQWSGQTVLFAMKAVELLEPIVNIDRYDDLFAYFESEEVVKQIDDLQQLCNIKKEFAENTQAVYVKYGPDRIGQMEIDVWKSYIVFREVNKLLTENEKERIGISMQSDISYDYRYFSQMIEDIMSGKSSLRVPSQKDIDMAQKSLDENGV